MTPIGLWGLLGPETMSAPDIALNANLTSSAT